jgi:predicted dehydrogenase
MAYALGAQPAIDSNQMTSERLTVGLSGCGAATTLYHAPALQILESEGRLHVSALFDPEPTALAQSKDCSQSPKPFQVSTSC